MNPTPTKRQRISDTCIVLGSLFTFLFLIVLLLTIFSAFFWGGMQFHEGPQPTRSEYLKAIIRDFFWTFFHRTIFFAVPPTILLWCGYRLRHPKQNHRRRTQRRSHDRES